LYEICQLIILFRIQSEMELFSNLIVMLFCSQMMTHLYKWSKGLHISCVVETRQWGLRLETLYYSAYKNYNPDKQWQLKKSWNVCRACIYFKDWNQKIKLCNVIQKGHKSEAMVPRCGARKDFCNKNRTCFRDKVAASFNKILKLLYALVLK
jgi:hypothetical protein